MSPTVFNYRSYHFEAKFWIEPVIALATNHGLSPKQLKEIQRIVEAHKNEIKKSWQKHFKR